MAEETKKKKSLSLIRYINTNIWNDSKFEELNINEKLLFLYALTNRSTNLCGAYEITKKTISFETGIDKKELDKCFATLENKGMVKYDSKTNEIYVVNFLKHNIQNEKCEKNALRFYESLKSNSIKEEILSYMSNNFTLLKDTPYIGYTYGIDERDKRIENSDKGLELSEKGLVFGVECKENRERRGELREKGLEKEFEEKKGKGVKTLNNTELDFYALTLNKDINAIVNAYDELKKNNFITEYGESIRTSEELSNYFKNYDENN